MLGRRQVTTRWADDNVQKQYGNIDMDHLATKSSSRDDFLVARLTISTNMLHKPDLYAAIYGTIVCPRTQITTPKVSPTGDTTPHNTDYSSSLQYMQPQCRESINISNLTSPGIEPGDIWFV